jgi:hypothetical protein
VHVNQELGGMTTDSARKYADSEVEQAIEDALEALRWCRKHRNERKAVDTLRVVQADLGYIALALDWGMEGEEAKAEKALRMLWAREEREVYDRAVMTMQGH